MKLKMNAKLAIRIAIVVVGTLGAFVAASVQPVSALDGMPLFLCPPGAGSNCVQTTLPPPK